MFLDELQPAHLFRCRPIDGRKRFPLIDPRKQIRKFEELSRLFDRQADQDTVAIIIQDIIFVANKHGLVIPHLEDGATLPWI